MEKSKKTKTGIWGLDVVLEGGLLDGRGVILIGGPGTGKTILLSEFIYRGITDFHQNGVFVTFEERPKYIMENLNSFGWDYEKLIRQNKLMIVDASPGPYCEEISDCYDLEPLLARIKYAVGKVHAQRVVIDGLGNLFQKFTNKKVVREMLYSVSDELKKMRISFMLSVEKPYIQDNYSVEEYVSDGVLELSRETSQNKIIRNIEVIKMRGTSFMTGKITFEIGADGIALYPKVFLDSDSYKKKSNVRCKFGIPELDQALGGGLSEGSVIVLVGGTGTGKTTLSMKFLHEGLINNQNALCISFKDSAHVIERISANFGWNFNRYLKERKLTFLTKPEHPDKLIYTVIETIKKMKIKRVVIDSIAFIDPTVAYPNKVTEFYITLMMWLKINGVTCIMNYLTVENDYIEKEALFSSLEAPLRRVLNALPDGIIVLNHVKDDDIMRKELHILKLRGSNHGRGFYAYEVDKKGFRLNNERVIESEISEKILGEKVHG